MKIYIDSGSGYVERTDLFLRGRVKFDRAEGEIGHTEAVIDFQDNFTASRGDKVKIEKGTKNIYLTVEKMVTNERKNRRVVAKDKIYFIKDKPLPAAVFVDVNLSDIMNWVKTQGGFDSYTVTPSGTADPKIAFFYVEEDTKIGELLGDIAEAIQGSVFAAVTDVSSEGNSIRFNAACLKTFNNTELMTLTADQLGSDEISDLPRQHNQFTLKFKKKKQIPDTLVFRGASHDDAFEVPADGYPEDSSDSYYAEFENPVISITDHSFDGYNCYIDQTTWRSNIDGGTDYGDLLDPFKFKLKFGSDGTYGGTIYDFRIYGNAIKEDEITETLDISGSDYAKIKEYSSELVTSGNDWHKKFIAWVTSKSYEKRSITVVDPSEDFVGLMTLMYGIGANKDNRVIKIDGEKMTVETATYDMAKDKWQLEGFKTRTSTTYSGYIEKMKSTGSEGMEKKLIEALDIIHPADGTSETSQLVLLREPVKNYTVDVTTVYSEVPTTADRVNTFVTDKQEGKFVFNSYYETTPYLYDYGSFLVTAPSESGSLVNWGNKVLYPVDPGDGNPDEASKSSGRLIDYLRLEVKVGNTVAASFLISVKDVISTNVVKVSFWWNYRTLWSWYEYKVQVSDNNGNRIFPIPDVGSYSYDVSGYTSPMILYITKIATVGDLGVIDGKYRLRVFQDTNYKRREGIQNSLASPRSIIPVTYAVATVADGTTPAFSTSVYTIGSSEKWTAIEFKDSSGNVIETKHIPLEITATEIEFVAYRYTTHDGYTYMDYKTDVGTRKTLNRYDPSSVIANISAKEVV